MILTGFIFTLVTITSVLCHPSCLSTCRFALCEPTTVSLFSPADVPLTSAICLRNRRLGVVHTSQAFVRPASDRPFSSISSFNPPSLGQSFSSSFFKTYSTLSNFSAIGHETPQQNQSLFLQGACIALPITSFQILGAHHRVIRNVRTPARPFVDCVSFTVSKATNTRGPPSTVRTTVAATSTIAETTGTTTSLPATRIPPTTTTAVTTAVSPSTTTTSPSTTASVVSSTTAQSKPTETATTAVVTTTPAPTVPPLVKVDETVEFPPTTEIGKGTSFKFEVDVSGSSGSTKEDFYLLSDATSSMGSAISTAQDRFRSIVESRQAASSNVAFGVGYYRDQNEPDSFTNVQSITKNVGLVQSGIDSLVARSIPFVNSDVPEAALFALYQVATQNDIGWRPDARRLLVYFGDAPGQEPTCADGLRLTRKNVITALKEKSITVVAISFVGGSTSPGLNAPTLSYECFPEQREMAGNQATNITSATGGNIFEADEQSAVIESIVTLVGDLAQELEADTSDCAEKDIDVSFEPALPLSISAGEKVTVTETVQVGEGVCGPSGSGFSCKVRFTLGGALLGVQSLTAKSVVGC